MSAEGVASLSGGGDRFEELDGFLGPTAGAVDLGQGVGVGHPAGLGQGGPGVVAGLEGGGDQVEGGPDLGVGLGGLALAAELLGVAPVGVAGLDLGVEAAGRFLADGLQPFGGVGVLAASHRDLAEGDAGGVGLLGVGPGLGGVGGQRDEVVEVAEPIDPGVGVVGHRQRRHADLGRLGGESALGVAAGEVLGEDRGGVEVPGGILAVGEEVAGAVDLLDLLGLQGPADRLVQEVAGEVPVLGADGGVGLAHRVLVGEARDLVDGAGGLGLELPEELEGLGLVGREVAHDLAEPVDGLGPGVGLLALVHPGEEGDEVLRQLQLNA